MLPRALARIALDRMETARRLAEHFAQGLDARGREPKAALPVAFQPAPTAGLRHDRSGDEGQHVWRCSLQTDRDPLERPLMRDGIGTFCEPDSVGPGAHRPRWAAPVPVARST